MTLPTIALLTDFGNRDAFAGTVKGMIYRTIQSYVEFQSCPMPPILDVTHEISPFDISAAAWVLENVYREFPPNTVFVCIADPKVGQPDQRKLLVHQPDRRLWFIGPDNGLLTPVIRHANSAESVYAIENRRYFRHVDGEPCVSNTFHGRDIYAPVAGHLAAAIMGGRHPDFLELLGSKVSNPLLLNISEPKQLEANGKQHHLAGEVVYVDRYGNLITNLPHEWTDHAFRSGEGYVSLKVGGHIHPLRCVQSYSQAPDHQTLLLIPSSSGNLEIAVNQGNANEHLKLKIGTPIEVLW